MEKSKTPLSHWIAIALGLGVFGLTKLLPAPQGLPEAGFQILGLLVGAIVLFLFCGTGWTSMAVVFALMTVPGLSVAQVTQATFGNSTAVFLLFCMMLAVCLTKSGVARRVAVWFLTNPLARKSPWWTVAMYFAAVYVLDFVLSAATCIMILMPLLLSIFESIGLEDRRKGSLATMMLLGTVVVAQLANGANPISHAVTIQGFSLFESYTGQPMDFFTYCMVCTPISLAGSLLFFLMARALWRPDVSPFTGIDYKALAASCGPMTKKEKVSLAVYLSCVVLWLLPGLSHYLLPGLAPALSGMSNCLPPLLALFFMDLVLVDGEKVLDWTEAIKGISWPTFLFIASIMGLGSFMGREEVGISQWLTQVMSPVFQDVPALAFLAIMVSAVCLLTNFCSNAVALSVIFALAMPLAMSMYGGSIDPALAAMLIISGAQDGWATVPATPTAAVAYTAGYGDTMSILRWGLFFMLLQIALSILLGLPLGRLLL